MYYVTDTHSLIWYLTNDKRIGKKAYSMFNKADKREEIIVIPTIILASKPSYADLLSLQGKYN